MDISTLINGGWIGFIAVILAAAALIASLWLGRSADETVRVNGKILRYPFGPTPFFGVALIWTISRGWLPDKWLGLTPVALIVPALDAAIFAASLAVLFRSLAMSFSPDWTWRTGIRQWRFYLLPVLIGRVFFEDLRAYPAEWWCIAGLEAALLLPFLLRLGYDERQSSTTEPPDPRV